MGSIDEINEIFNSIVYSIITKEKLEKIHSEIFLSLYDLIITNRLYDLITINRTYKKIPKPPNKFIIFRKNFQARMMHEEGPQCAHNLSIVSKEAKIKWNSLGSEQQEIYETIADIATKLHRRIFPKYINKPKSPNRSLHEHMYFNHDRRMNNHDTMNTISKPIELATTTINYHYDRKLISSIDNFFYKT